MGIMLKARDKGPPSPLCLEAGGGEAPLLETCYQVLDPQQRGQERAKFLLWGTEEGSYRGCEEVRGLRLSGEEQDV